MGSALSSIGNVIQSGASDIFGTNKTATAIGAAGTAVTQAGQQGVAMAQEGYQEQLANRAAGVAQAQQAAQMNPAEIAQIQNILSSRDSQLSQQLQSINQQQTQLNNMDPQVKAAGSNYYNLLSGQSAAILAPMQQQMANQRQALQASLAGQMGPGYATSSAGIQAMTQFDQQAALSTAQAQMSAVQIAGSQYMNLAGMQQQGQQAVTQQTGQAYGQYQQATGMVNQEYQFGTQQQLQATLGAQANNQLNPFAGAQAQMNYAGMAGNMFAGQIYQGQAGEQITGNLLGVGATSLLGEKTPGSTSTQGAGSSGYGPYGGGPSGVGNNAGSGEGTGNASGLAGMISSIA